MPWSDDLRGKAPTLLLGVAVGASSALLLALGSGLTFFQDTWAFLLTRPGFSADTFFTPHNEHIVVIPVAIEKLLVEVFGTSSALPERIVLTVVLAATAILVFAYVRRRLGGWPALMGAVLLLFLGQGWEVLLWPFEISLAGSSAAGVAALLALERDDRRGDLAACLLLTVSVACSSVGLAFAAGAAVEFLLRVRKRGWARVYVAAVPILLYGAWYLGYGADTESTITLRNVVHSPLTVVEGFSASAAAMLGLAPIGGELGGHARTWLGFAALICLVAGFGYLQLRRPGFFARLRTPGLSPRLWPVLAAALTFWLLAGFNGRGAEASRYMHIGVVFILLIAADLLDGARLRRPALIAAGAVTVAAAVANLIPMLEGRDLLRDETVLTRSDLASIEIARRSVDPDFWLDPGVAGTVSLINVGAAGYLSMADDSGSPAYTVSELEAAPLAGRRQADIVLSAALPVTIETTPGSVPAAARRFCRALPGREGVPSGLPLSPGVTWIGVPAGAPAALRLRRFSDGEYPVDLGAVAGGSVARLTIPPDRSRRPWQLGVSASGRTVVCEGRP
jgi:hypothetical protein